MVHHSQHSDLFKLTANLHFMKLHTEYATSLAFLHTFPWNHTKTQFRLHLKKNQYALKPFKQNDKRNF